MRSLLRRLLPFPLRVELVRLRGAPLRRLERRAVALERVPEDGLDRFGFLLAERRSRLRREPVYDERLQRGKERNVARAARALDLRTAGCHYLYRKR
jgi:hypothetical protein